MSDERTVRDFTREHWRTPMRMLDELGLDPDMPVAQLRADLAIAKRARETERHEVTMLSGLHAAGWNDCLNFIVGTIS